MAFSSASRIASSLALVGAALAFAPQAQATLVYSNNFDAPAFQLGSVSSTTSFAGIGSVLGGPYAGSNGKQWAGSFMHNASAGNPAGFSTVILSGLGAHTQVSIDLMLGFLDSWDSTNGSVSPDQLEFWIDGVNVATLTTAIASGTINNYAGGTLVTNGQIDTNQFFSDNLVDMGTAGFLTFAHTGSTLTFQVRASGAGWQGGTDESWGMDDLRISIDGNTVPEPGSLALLGAALLGAALGRRRT